MLKNIELSRSDQLSQWWTTVQSAEHPLDRATRGLISIADFHQITVSNEHDVVNNVLFMLQGFECDMFMLESSDADNEECQIDTISENAFASTEFQRYWTWKLRYKLELPTVVSETMKPILSHFMSLATEVARMKKAIEVGKRGFGACTFIFVHAVSDYLQAYSERIFKLQEAHNKRSMTLISLHAMLGEQKAQITFLSNLVSKSLAPLPEVHYSALVDDLYPDRPRKSKAERAATIFQILEEAMGQTEDERSLRLVLFIFWKILEPLLDQIDRWMLYSYLSPSDQDEFCILRASSEPVSSPIFWTTAYTSIQDEVPKFLSASITRILATGKASLLIQHIQQSLLKDHTLSSANHFVSSQFEPLFFQSKFLISQHFESSWHIFGPNSNFVTDLFKEELAGRNHEFGESDSSGSLVAADYFSNNFRSSAVSKSASYSLGANLNISLHSDDFLDPQTNFFGNSDFDGWPSSLSANRSNLQQQRPRPSSKAEFNLANVTQLGIPISSIFHECIAAPINERYQVINAELMKLLIDKCGILKHIEAAQRMFFIHNPFYDLCTLSILPALWNYTTVGEVTASHWLKQALDTRYDDQLFAQLQRVSLHVIGAKTGLPSSKSVEGDETQLKSMKKVEDLQKIWIDYEAAWPESLFLNNETHEMYNSISRVLLKVMAAQYGLEQLTTANKNSAPSTSVLHKMQLFRNELLLFVRCMREYMVSRIQQVPWAELEIEMRRCADLDAMLDLHKHYLLQIRERLLITEKFASLRKAIDRILAIAIDFSRQFQVLHTSMTPSSISAHASSSTQISQDNRVFGAGDGVDSATLERVWRLADKSRQEFLKLFKFLLVILSKMSSSSIHLADLQLRLNFSGFYDSQ